MSILNKNQFQKMDMWKLVVDNALEEDDKFCKYCIKIDELIKQGLNPNDISILTYTNDDVLNLYYYLKQKFDMKISTEMTSKLINQQNVKSTYKWNEISIF